MSLIGGGLAVLILLIFLLAIPVLAGRIAAGRRVRLRPLPAYEAARQAIARAAEEGRTTHLSAGPGGAGDNTTGTAQTLAGLQIMGRLARRTAASSTALVGTTGGALALPLAENMVRSGYEAAGRPPEPAPADVRLLAQRDPLAYAAAAADLSAHEGLSNAVLAGAWGPEYLLVNEAQSRAGVQAVAGATDPSALATMYIGANGTLTGEELYTAGAYLDHEPAHIASLLAQDAVRILLIVLILLGALLASLGLQIETLFGVAR